MDLEHELGAGRFQRSISISDSFGCDDWPSHSRSLEVHLETRPTVRFSDNTRSCNAFLVEELSDSRAIPVDDEGASQVERDAAETRGDEGNTTPVEEGANRAG
jgi:hypothetical protein